MLTHHTNVTSIMSRSTPISYFDTVRYRMLNGDMLDVGKVLSAARVPEDVFSTILEFLGSQQELYSLIRPCIHTALMAEMEVAGCIIGRIERCGRMLSRGPKTKVTDVREHLRLKQLKYIEETFDTPRTLTLKQYMDKPVGIHEPSLKWPCVIMSSAWSPSNSDFFKNALDIAPDIQFLMPDGTFRLLKEERNWSTIRCAALKNIVNNTPFLVRPELTKDILTLMRLRHENMKSDPQIGTLTSPSYVEDHELKHAAWKHIVPVVESLRDARDVGNSRRTVEWNNYLLKTSQQRAYEDLVEKVD
jgi:hypothetical protein